MEAFVYCWTDRKTNKLYVGSHKGSIDDGYICSSKYMLEEYNKRPEDFSRQIVAAGRFEECLKLETIILKSVNAKNDEKFYNLHNGDGNFYIVSHSEETKRKISQARKGRALTEEHRKKIKQSLAKSEKFKQRIESNSFANYSEKNGMFGRKHSEETKEKMRKKRLGKKDEKWVREKKSKSKIGALNPAYGKPNVNCGKKWYHNPLTKESKRFAKTEQIPLEWIKGRGNFK